MPRKDKVHPIVRTALEKDGWLITHDPYFVKSFAADYEVDLGAEKLLAAEKGTTKIAIEAKSFLKASFANEFHSVLGQYLNYAALISVQEPDRALYLAVSKVVFDNYFQQPATAFVVKTYKLKLLIFNPLTETITEWLEE
jgi:XisH protein